MQHKFNAAALCTVSAFALAAGLIVGVIGGLRTATPDPGRYLDLANSRNVADVVSLCAMWPENFKTKTDDMEACRIAQQHFLAQTFQKE